MTSALTFFLNVFFSAYKNPAGLFNLNFETKDLIFCRLKFPKISHLVVFVAETIFKILLSPTLFVISVSKPLLFCLPDLGYFCSTHKILVFSFIVVFVSLHLQSSLQKFTFSASENFFFGVLHPVFLANFFPEFILLCRMHTKTKITVFVQHLLLGLFFQALNIEQFASFFVATP